MIEKLKEIQHELKTQDNRITADPIFLVEECIRIYGMDKSYADDDQIIWYHCDGMEADEDEKAILDELEENCEKIEDCWKKVAFMDKWIPVQSFFTEKAALEYIERNKHRHSGKLRTYADSLYRNPEMKMIRDYILNIE